MYLGGLKKDIKKALKSTDAAKIAKALAAEQAKINKAPASKKAAKRIDYVNQLTAQLAKAQAPSAPLPVSSSTPVTATTPDIPSGSMPLSFGSSGGGASFAPSPVADDAAALPPEETNYLPWILGAAGVGLALMLFLRRKR